MSVVLKVEDVGPCRKQLTIEIPAPAVEAETSRVLREYSSKHGGMDAVFSEFNLDSAEVVEIPKMTVYSSHLQQGIDPEHADRQGIPAEVV